MAALTLNPFNPDLAAQVLSWLTSFQESVMWCGRRQFPLAPDDLLTWHIDPDVHPYLLIQAGTPIAYGEIHLHTDAQEAELLHLLVAPQHRDQGTASTLVHQLLATLHTGEISEVVARIPPHNATARHVLEKQGFVRMPTSREEERNQWEAAPFEWYVYALAAHM